MFAKCSGDGSISKAKGLRFELSHCSRLTQRDASVSNGHGEDRNSKTHLLLDIAGM